jgi:WD40 repeat protein
MATANPDTIKQVRTVKLPGDLLSVARLPGKDELFVGGADGKIHHLDLSVAKPEPATWAAHASYVSGLVTDGQHLISAGWDRKLSWWNAATRAPVRTVENAHKKWIRHLAVTPDGRTAASVGDDMVCRLWDAATAKPGHQLRGHAEMTPHHFPSKLYTCAFSADGKHLATGDHVGRIVVWETATGKQATAFDAPAFYHWDFDRNNHSAGGIRSLAFSPDGKQLAAGGIENKDVAIIIGNPLVQVFDWRKGQKTHEFRVGTNFVFENLRFHHAGAWLMGAAGGVQAAAKLVFFDLEQKKVLRDVAAPMPVYGMTMNGTSTSIYGVGRGLLVQWDLAS